MDTDLVRLDRLIRAFMHLDEEFVIKEETTVLSICEDSMSLYEFVMEIEDEFDTNIPNPEKLTTIGDILKAISDGQ